MATVPCSWEEAPALSPWRSIWKGHEQSWLAPWCVRSPSIGFALCPSGLPRPWRLEQIQSVPAQPLAAVFPAQRLLCPPGFPVSVVLQMALLAPVIGGDTPMPSMMAILSMNPSDTKVLKQMEQTRSSFCSLFSESEVQSAY